MVGCSVGLLAERRTSKALSPESAVESAAPRQSPTRSRVKASAKGTSSTCTSLRPLHPLLRIAIFPFPTVPHRLVLPCQHYCKQKQ